MEKHLYFTCPTDYLEAIIDRTFEQENYFCNSLGNSIEFRCEELDEIKDLLETKEIRKISFVFSDDNQIVSDALTGQLYSNLSGIDYFYDDLMRRQNDLRMIWELCDDRIMLLSCYLLDKVEKLRRELDFTVNQRLDIDVKIYHRNEKTFKKAHNDLFGLRHHHLN